MATVVVVFVVCGHGVVVIDRQLATTVIAASVVERFHLGNGTDKSRLAHAEAAGDDELNRGDMAVGRFFRQARTRCIILVRADSSISTGSVWWI